MWSVIAVWEVSLCRDLQQITVMCHEGDRYHVHAIAFWRAST